MSTERTRPNTGGPAFPIVEPNHETPIVLLGMTLRDYFAGQAMGGFLGCQDFMNEAARKVGSKEEALVDVARWSYKTADAMLAERTKPPEAE